MKFAAAGLTFILGLTLTGLCASVVVATNVVRLGVVFGGASVFAGLFFLLAKGRRLRVAFFAGIAVVIGFILLVPQRTSPEELRYTTADKAQEYLGTPYVWGGESEDGIDCSGLLRAAQRDAALSLAWRYNDPALLRFFATSWLIDVPAKGMLAGRGTEVLATADSILQLPPETRKKGDFIATVDGAHVMMVVGENFVIEADPAIGRVIVVEISDRSSPWMKRKVVALRPN